MFEPSLFRLKTPGTLSHIPPSLAKQLYTCWLEQAENLKSSNDVNNYFEDIWKEQNCEITSSISSKAQEITQNFQNAQKPTSLKEIQKEERMIKVAEERNQKYMSQVRQKTMATRLVEERLIKIFKGKIDSEVMREICRTNNYQHVKVLENCANLLDVHVDQLKQKSDGEIVIYDAGLRFKNNHLLTTQQMNFMTGEENKYLIWNEYGNGENIDEIKLGSDFYDGSSLEDFGGINESGFREAYCKAKLDEALHEKIMNSYQQKIANLPSKSLSKSFYVQESQKHRKLAKKSGKMAAYILLSERFYRRGPGILDLHHLNEREAMETVKNYLSQQHVAKLKNRNTNRVEIITGTGKNTTHSMAQVVFSCRDFELRLEIQGNTF